jgi:hypothetical protein
MTPEGRGSLRARLLREPDLPWIHVTYPDAHWLLDQADEVEALKLEAARWEEMFHAVDGHRADLRVRVWELSGSPRGTCPSCFETNLQGSPPEVVLSR